MKVVISFEEGRKSVRVELPSYIITEREALDYFVGSFVGSNSMVVVSEGETSIAIPISSITNVTAE